MDYGLFVKENQGKTFKIFEHLGFGGEMALSRKSALQPNGPEGVTLGLHLIVSYEHAEMKTLDDDECADLLAEAYRQVSFWKRQNRIPGELSLGWQEQGWGTRNYFHVHFYLAVTANLSAAGYEPRRYVEWESRLKLI
jgi:hypothetical protein